MTEKRPSRQRRGATDEIAIAAASVCGGIALVVVAELAGLPSLRWLGAGLVIAGLVAMAAMGRR